MRFKKSNIKHVRNLTQNIFYFSSRERSLQSITGSRSSILTSSETSPWPTKRRRASTFHEGDNRDESPYPKWRRRGSSFHETRQDREENESLKASEHISFPILPPCTCPYFGEKQNGKSELPKPAEVKIISSDEMSTSAIKINGLDVDENDSASSSPARKLLFQRTAKSGSKLTPNNMLVTWESGRPIAIRRGSSCGYTKSSVINANQRTPCLLRRSATTRHHPTRSPGLQDRNKNSSSPCLQRYTCNDGSIKNSAIRTHHSRNSSVISRNSSRHGRIIRLEQKATQVLGVVFFTFVILWSPFFVLNLLPMFCEECENEIGDAGFQFVTWLGYASSMVNPIFYTIFNKVFRQAFKKVLMCRYRNRTWRPHR